MLVSLVSVSCTTQIYNQNQPAELKNTSTAEASNISEQTQTDSAKVVVVAYLKVKPEQRIIFCSLLTRQGWKL